ncbi:OBG-type G domain-containing protein, partial [Haematococcus lacustris]
TNHLATPLVVADLPGLLAGAHENRGRGNEFLRHVQRVRCVAYVLDLTGGQPGSLSDRPPAEQLSVLE